MPNKKCIPFFLLVGYRKRFLRNTRTMFLKFIRPINLHSKPTFQKVMGCIYMCQYNGLCVGKKIAEAIGEGMLRLVKVVNYKKI